MRTEGQPTTETAQVYSEPRRGAGEVQGLGNHLRFAEVLAHTQNQNLMSIFTHRNQSPLFQLENTGLFHDLESEVCRLAVGMKWFLTGSWNLETRCLVSQNLLANTERKRKAVTPAL